MINEQANKDLLTGVSTKNPQMVYDALAAGGNPNQELNDGTGNKLIHNAVLACKDNDTAKMQDARDVLRLILKSDHIRLNVQNNKGETASHLAAEVGRDDVVFDLISAGSSLSIVDNSGKRANDAWKEARAESITDAYGRAFDVSPKFVFIPKEKGTDKMPGKFDALAKKETEKRSVADKAKSSILSLLGRRGAAKG